MRSAAIYIKRFVLVSFVGTSYSSSSSSSSPLDCPQMGELSADESVREEAVGRVSLNGPKR